MLPVEPLGRYSRKVLGSRAGRGPVLAVTVVLVWLLLANALPNGAPAGIILSGAVFGAINGLLAISIVLVYRANRVINFAAAEFGSVAAVSAIEFHVQLGMNYFLCVGVGVLIALILGAALEMTILRRFTKAPRLIVAVVTIGVAQILNIGSVIIPIEWQGHSTAKFTTPFNVHFMIFPVLFNGNYIAAIVVVPIVLLGLVWFLNYTNYGTAIRAAADNGDRARLLGVPVNRLSTVVWALTGVLSALAAILRVPILGFSSFTSVSQSGPQILLVTLAAAVMAGMTSLPGAVIGSVGIGIAEQLGAWTFHDSSYVDAMLVLVILAALLIRRDHITRSAETGISTWQAIRPVRAVPPELTRFRQVRLTSAGVRLAVLAFALVLPFILTPAHTQLTAIIFLYAMVAAALVILTGWSGHISLGHIAFMGVGAATTGILVGSHHWDLFAALAVGVVVAAAVAVILGLPALRITGQFLAVVTLAFAYTAQYFFFVQPSKLFSWWIPSQMITRPALFGRIGIDSDRQIYYVCLVALAVVLAATRSLRNSHAGRALIASNDNRLATQSFGMSTTRLHLVAFAVSGAIAGLAGGLFVIQQEAFNVGSFQAIDGLTFFTMVVIGGLGSIPGAVLGAVFVYGAQYLLPGGWGVLSSAAFMVVLLMVLPGGLGEAIFRVRDAALRRFAARKGVLVPSLLADQRQEDGAATPDFGAPTIFLEEESAAPETEPVPVGATASSAEAER
ncbi:MAG TPA: ABC transporter permease [Acidimicrobiales bacterium]|nr:ABC transporter permease [Acidimicrobiales bacterium]